MHICAHLCVMLTACMNATLAYMICTVGYKKRNTLLLIIYIFTNY